MATQYYWQVGQETGGPIPFQDLAGLVRDRIINEDDLVRPTYSKEWQTADSVVGLFYMAQRVPVPRPEPPPVPDLDLIPEADPVADLGLGDLDQMFALADEIASSRTDADPSDESGIGADRPNDLPSRSLMDIVESAKPDSIPKIPFWRKTQTWLVRNWFVFGAAAVLLIIGSSWSAYATSRSADLQRYTELQQVLKTIQQQRASDQPDFEPVKAQIERIVREYPEALAKEGAGLKNPIKKKLQVLALEILPKILKADLKSRSPAEKYMISRLNEVGEALGFERGKR